MRNKMIKHYTEKFKNKMAGSLPKAAAWWIDGINGMATLEEKKEIWLNVLSDIDWISQESEAEAGDFPEWASEWIIEDLNALYKE